MLTVLFVPKIMTLDLREGDRRYVRVSGWLMVAGGAAQAGLVLTALVVPNIMTRGLRCHGPYARIPLTVAAGGAAQAGLVLTVLFVPNIMTLDLREGDRRFDALMAGNPGAYNGEAVAPQNLSMYERCAPPAAFSLSFRTLVLHPKRSRSPAVARAPRRRSSTGTSGARPPPRAPEARVEGL